MSTSSSILTSFFSWLTVVNYHILFQVIFKMNEDPEGKSASLSLYKEIRLIESVA